MAQKNTREIGKKYERLVKNYLVENDYEILVENFYFKHVEIDLIAKIENILVFVEVKFRKKMKNYNPFLAISEKKKASIQLGAKAFLVKNPKYNSFFCRFDAVFVIKDTEEEFIKHYKDAFRVSR